MDFALFPEGPPNPTKGEQFLILCCWAFLFVLWARSWRRERRWRPPASRSARGDRPARWSRDWWAVTTQIRIPNLFVRGMGIMIAVSVVGAMVQWIYDVTVGG